jgi:hypothetical protein
MNGMNVTGGGPHPRRLIAAGFALTMLAGFLAYRAVRPKVRTEVLGVQLTPAPTVPVPGTRAEDPVRGLHYQGLAKTAACKWALGLERTGRCTHGPDPAPEGVNVLLSQPPAGPVSAPDAGGGDPQQTTLPAGGQVLCDGDGVTGKRVQALYAHPPGTDRYGSYLSSFRTWAAGVDAVFDASAAETGGSRHVRYVTDSGCNLAVDNVAVSSAAAGDFDTTISELEAKGYNRTDRIYLIWMDANTYCGIGTMWVDDQPGAGNRNNAGPSYARTDAGCWGMTAPVEAHELMHNLGAVQNSAPHTTGGHCFDEWDRMCYDDDGPGPVSMQTICTDTGHDRLFDCNHDDYFYAGTPPPTNYLATHWNTANSGFLITITPVSGSYTPLTPARMLDSRDGTGGLTGKLGPAGTFDLQVTGRGGVPTAGVSAVVLNITAVDPTLAGHLTVFPAGVPRPDASNLNFAGGQVVPNLVVAKVGTGGKISLFNAAGATHVLADVSGWFSDSPAGAAGRYRPLTPARILDTRDGTGGFSTKVGPGATIDLQVGGRGGVPGGGAAAVVLNVTVTGTTDRSHVTVFPAGGARPDTSNLNFTAGQTVPNRVIAKLGTSGRVSIYNAAGATDVIADVGGWFTDASGTTTPPGEMTGLTPFRILDTRFGTGGFSSKVGPGASIDVQVSGLGGVPSSGATAAVLNVTVTNPTANGHLTVWPAGVARPLASDLNFAAGQTVPNLVVVKLGAGGKVSVHNPSGSTDVIFDVVGWLS